MKLFPVLVLGLVSLASTAAAAIIDPPLASYFRFQAGTKVTGNFRGVSGLGNESTVIETLRVNPDGSSTITKRPGEAKYYDVTFRRGLTGTNEFWIWRQEVLENRMNEAKVPTARLILYDQEGQEAAEWTLINVWPRSLAVKPDTATDALFEEMVIVCEGITRVR